MREICIRGIDLEDIDYILACENNRNFWTYSDTLIPFSRITIEQFILSSKEEYFYINGQTRFIIYSKNPENKEEEKHGILDVFDYHPIHRRLSFGILINTNDRGLGYAEKALQELFVYSRQHWNIHQIYGEVKASNSSALNLFEKCGFIKCAYKKEWYCEAGDWVDLVGFQKIL